MDNETLLRVYHESAKVVSSLREEIRKRDIHWMHLVEYGFRAEAVVAYRKQFDCTLLEAKHAIDSYTEKL